MSVKTSKCSQGRGGSTSVSPNTELNCEYFTDVLFQVTDLTQLNEFQCGTYQK